jgi:hypothetical protein
MSFLLGPILQFRGMTSTEYRVSALVVMPMGTSPPQAVLPEGGTVSAARKVADLPFEKDSKTFTAWRFDFILPLGVTTQVNYQINDFQGSFHLPATNESPRMAYASCNGFSDPKLMKQVQNKNDRWEHMAGMHTRQPYHLLLLGGDQVYSDDMWKRLPSLERWTDLPRSQRYKARFTVEMKQQIDAHFADLYIKRWAQPEPLAMLQSIPTIMMWDDHDIMDGWGSYPAEAHDCAVYQGIFETARRYFRVFQWHCAEDETHPCAIAGQGAFSLGFGNFGGVSLLVPDLRSERRPASTNPFGPDQIISPDSWNALYQWLDQAQGHRHLLLMSSIPVAYLDLGKIERLLSVLPGQQELEDDLRDHWRSLPHLQERLRLVHRLLDHARAKNCRVTILSGDVHVGALSVIESTRSEHTGSQAVINQLVSTGIVHPAPPALARYVLESISSEVEEIDRGITASMQSLTGNGRYLIGARNWLALEPDASGRIWANWHLEGTAQPLTKVIHG